MARRIAPEDTAAPYLPERLSLASLRRAVGRCRGCDLYQNATQAVFGEGLRRSRLMVVGEQPGDIEDREGRPFVGPAGRLLDKLLVAAGIDRDDVYVTNAVKHFKFHERGKKRIHDKPNQYQINACHPWLEAEIAVVQPEILVALGATAAQAIFGPTFRVTQHRREPLRTELAPITFATLHPSALLRIPDDAERRAARAEYIAELRFIGTFLDRGEADRHIRGESPP